MVYENMQQYKYNGKARASELIESLLSIYPVHGSEMRITDPAQIASSANKERFRFSGKELLTSSLFCATT